MSRDMNALSREIDQIWSVKYIPTKVEDLACTTEVREMLQKVVESGELYNHLCLYGTPGTGKNSIVNIIKSNLDVHMLVINASEENGIDDIRGKVLTFANSGAMFDKPKIIVMNEADGLTIQAQNSMRELMETKSKTCKFILTCNSINHISDPLKSRCLVFKVDPPMMEIVTRLQKILNTEKITVEEGFVEAFIKSRGRDLRKILNDCQSMYKSHGKLTVSLINENEEEYIKFFDELFGTNDLKKIGELVREQLFDDDVYTILARYCIEKDLPAESIPIVADHLYRSQSIYDKDLIFMSCILTLKQVAKK